MRFTPYPPQGNRICFFCLSGWGGLRVGVHRNPYSATVGNGERAHHPHPNPPGIQGRASNCNAPA